MTVGNQMTTSAELATARAALYQLLSSAYARPPDSGFLGSLARWSAAQNDNLSLLSELLRRGLATLNGFFAQIGPDSWEELEKRVSVEFTYLFRGVKPFYSPPPPYESVYREEDGRVFSELTVAVREEYRRFGLDLAEGLISEPPDHISFELEFMNLLCRKEAEAWEKDEEAEAQRLLWAEREFITEHLAIWLSKFCDKIREYDRSVLFSGLADLTEGWTAFDFEQYLQDVEPPASEAT